MASKEAVPQVSVSSLPESLRNGNNTLKSRQAVEARSVAERGDLAHAGRVLSRIENGHNTTPVRHEAVSVMRKGILPEGSPLRNQMLEDLTRSWRHLGTVPDAQLDTNYEYPKTSKKDKKAA